MSTQDQDEFMEENSDEEIIKEKIHINEAGVPPFRPSETYREEKTEDVSMDPKLRSILQQKIHGMHNGEEYDMEPGEEGEPIDGLPDEEIQNRIQELSQKINKPKQKLRKYKMSKREMKVEESKVITRAKIVSLQNYLKSERFGDYLRECTGKTAENIPSMEDDELDDTYRHISCLLAKRYKQKWIENMTSFGLKMTEMGVSTFFNIRGFHNMMLANTDFLDCLEELKLSIPGPTLAPHVRIGLIAAQTAMMCNQLNEMRGGSSMDRPMPMPSNHVEPSQPVTNKNSGNKII